MPETRLESTWMVVVEATAGFGRQPYPFDTIRKLVAVLAGWRATGLYCAERYAVQLEVGAATCSEALRLAISAHNGGTKDLGMAPPLFLRAEILTPEVLREDWRELGRTPPVAKPNAVEFRVYDATRALLQVSTEAQIRRILAEFVAGIGGWVSVGPRPAEAGIVTGELGLSPGDQVYATGEALSIGGMLLELSLPALVDDARRALQRLRRQPDPH